MKKYKIHFSLTNLLNDTQAEVVRLQQYFKGLTAIIGGSTWIMSNANNVLIVGIIGFVFDTLIACLYFEKIKS